jgi:murein DD-endopeptidase MepM/ murein hydrolase activator NlpD
MRRCRFVVVFLCLSIAGKVLALDLCLPTANDAVLRPGHDAEFFQPTVEGTPESGMFGCVRRDGARFHEGVDIKCLQRDRHGEPIDPVHAVADGEVAFINAKPGLSNYGRYIVLRHRWNSVEAYTLYAHLSEVGNGLVVDQPVRKGQVIATMGHSTNTRERISQDRAHLHFEVDLLLNPNFHIWYPKHDPKAPPFGNFNGLNLFGMNPAALFRANAADLKLSFADFVSQQPVAFTVLVGARPFPWLTMHPEQVQPAAAKPGHIVAYEVGATMSGLPVSVWPRTAEEITDAQRSILQRGLPVLVRVNEASLASSGNCCGLIRQRKRGHGWELGDKGREWVEMLTYVP